MKTTKQKLDELIDWYERYKPHAGRAIFVHLTRKTAMRFAKPKTRGGPLYYREREIITREHNITRAPNLSVIE